ncbi:heavy metal-binding protein HIP-like isoform X2 [Ruditapes philippinarum]|uniref:heavy metal-binding protein HIP-like isoform X2 n=1 Tax=Ruditapes philippinarum TaxID=129788 RepID=UPI00295B3F8D|nr:heavy metal-binding protein HIP-like isoform X2 [Ruditapes philippinarum]
MKCLFSILVIIGNSNVLLANNDNCRENDLNALMVRLRVLRTEFADLKIKHEELINRIDLINDTQVVLKETNDNQETELRKHREEINNASSEIKLINIKNTKQEKELIELRKQINKTSSDINTENRKQDTELTKLRTEIDALKGGKVVASFTVTTPKMGATSTSLSFTTVITNEGNAFDSSTGKFTCPVSGLYYFSIHIVKTRSSSVDYAGCSIYLNGSSKVRAYTDPQDGTNGAEFGSYGVSTSVYFNLKVGDVVTIENCSGTIPGAVDSWTSFSGYLEKQVY